MSIFDQMSMGEKVKLANAMHAFLKPDKPFIRKSFKDTQHAESTLSLLSVGIPREDLVRLLKSINVPQPVIDQLPAIPKAVGPSQRTSLVKELPAFTPDTLAKLGAKEKVNLYNIMHKHKHGDAHKAIRKFRDNNLADTSLNCVAREIPKHQLADFMSKAKLDKDLVEQYRVAPPVPPSITKNGLAPEVEKKEKKIIRHETNPAKIIKPRLSLAAQRVLSAIQTLLPESKSKKAKQEIDTTRIADYLKTSIRFVCNTVRNDLFIARFIQYEDDTPDGGVEFLYVKLTAEGRNFKFDPGYDLIKLPAPQPGPKSKHEKSTSGASNQKVSKAPSAGSSSSAVGSNKRIFKLVDQNPRREGTWGWKSFNALKDGMTYREYIAAGGRNQDLKWDIDHGYVEVREAA